MIASILLCALLLSTASAAPLQRRQKPGSPSERGQLACFDIPNPLEPGVRVPVPCLYDGTSPRPNFIIDPTGTAPPASAATPLETALPGTVSTSTNAFDIQLDCEAGADQRADYCERVEEAFNQAGQMLSDIFQLTTTIVVNASVSPFCPNGLCGPGEGETYLGSASASRYIPLQDDDGRVRFYPQALVKQFNLASEPTYAPFDLRARFNSRPEVRNSWFRGDPDPSGYSSSDFLGTVVHELLHGLGFASAWFYQQESAIYPAAFGLEITGYQYTNGSFEYAGLYEYAFDRYLYLNGPTPTDSLPQSLTQVAQQIQDSILPNNGSVFGTYQTAPSSDFAEETYVTLAEQVIVPESLLFRTTSGTAIIMQTAYQGAWAQGSSGSHFDQSTYADTLNFLMCPRAERGSLAFRIAAFDPANADLSLGQVNTTEFLNQIDINRAIGSAVRETMRSMGYVLRSDAGSDVTPTAVPTDQATASAAVEPTASGQIPE